MAKKKEVIVVFEVNTAFQAESKEDLRSLLNASREMVKNFTPVRVIDENKSPLLGASSMEILGFDELTGEPIFEGDEVFSDNEGFITLRKNYENLHNVESEIGKMVNQN